MSIKSFVLLKILLRFMEFAQNRLELERIVSYYGMGIGHGDTINGCNMVFMSV